MARKAYDPNEALQQALDVLGAAAMAEAKRVEKLPMRDGIYEGRLEYYQSFARAEKNRVALKK